jgi:hypothetical protein
MQLVMIWNEPEKSLNQIWLWDGSWKQETFDSDNEPQTTYSFGMEFVDYQAELRMRLA